MSEKRASGGFPAAKPPRQGLVQVFTGDGKGKTSAALGVILRALGHGLRVCAVVFMKGDYPGSEWHLLSRMGGVKVARFGSPRLTDPANVTSAEKEQAHQALAAAGEALFSGDYDLVVLDEVNVAVAWGLLELDEVLRLVRDKPQNVGLVLTGRHADVKLVELADLVTECVKIKHPYDRGVGAWEGLDY